MNVGSARSGGAALVGRRASSMAPPAPQGATIGRVGRANCAHGEGRAPARGAGSSTGSAAGGCKTVPGEEAPGRRAATRARVLVSPHFRRLQAAHQYQGPTNDCGPYAAAMIVSALTGVRVDGRQLAREMDRPRWASPLPIIRRIPGHATFPWGLADILRGYGLRASWRTLSRELDLRWCLRAGWLAAPIIGSWRNRWAHYLVLVAWQPPHGYGFADPGRAGGALTWLARREFSKRWTSFGRTTVYVQPPLPAGRTGGG